MGADVKKLVVFSIRRDGRGATTWIKAGTAIANRDGTMNVMLDVLPIDGQLHVRPADTVPNEAKVDWAAMPEHMLKKKRAFELLFNEASNCVCEPRCATIDQHICKLSQALNVHKADCAHCVSVESEERHG